MIAEVDKDGSGAIDFDEFCHMMTAKFGERDTKEELMKAFQIIDQDKNVSPSSILNSTSSLFPYIGAHQLRLECRARSLLQIFNA